jgi:gliding motility-associated-like protein
MGCVPFCTLINADAQYYSGGVVNQQITIGKKIFSGKSASFCTDLPGAFEVRYSLTDSNLCKFEVSQEIMVFEKPGADFLFSPPAPLAGIDQVHFYDNSRSTNVKKFEWYFDGKDSANSFEKNPVHLFQRAGKYPVVLLVENVNGCRDTIIKTIFIEDEFSLYVPDAFTPNGDGLNEVFMPVVMGVTSYRLSIFDRWGQLIFDNKNISVGWNGEYKGTLCKTDVYIWKIQLEDVSGKTREFNGRVSLIK